MGLRQFDIKLDQFSAETSLRCDTDFIDFSQTPKETSFFFGDLFDVVEYEKKDRLALIDNIEDIPFQYSEIGNITKQGEVEAVTLDFSARDELVEDYFKKIEKGDIQIAQTGNILLSKVRPNLKKYVLIDEYTSKLFYTTALIQLKPKKLNKLLYYSLRTVFYNNLMSISRQGKGYPTLKIDDLFCIKLDSAIINFFEKNEKSLLDRIEPIEQKIKQLKAKIKAPQEVINRVFTHEFKIDIEKVEKEEQKKEFIVSSTLAFRNSNLRSSARWHKIAPIQEAMYENIACIKKLGNYIASTKNGWSPSCRESDSLNLVFGVSCISKNGVINYDDIKISDQSRTNIEAYFAQENDLFVSRGNTIDLVALASVAEDFPDEKNIIFPDLFIRIDIDEKRISKKYLAYLFNSIIGRYYFKYSAKGKNQTMVKISSDEINGFFLPVPPLNIQQRIINEIKIELDTQENVKTEIEVERNKIDEIIENAIKNS